MLSRASSTLLRSTTAGMLRVKMASRMQQTAQRTMAAGGISRQTHANLGTAFGFVCWMWIFYRAQHDLPVVLGWRHPWEHGPDEGHLVPVANEEELNEEWDSFYSKSVKPGEDDDDEDEEDDDEDEEEDDE